MITFCVMCEKNWQVSYHPATQKELAKLPADLQARLLRLADMLGIHGPVLPMPDNRKIDKANWGSMDEKRLAVRGIGSKARKNNQKPRPYFGCQSGFVNLDKLNPFVCNLWNLAIQVYVFTLHISPSTKQISKSEAERAPVTPALQPWNSILPVDKVVDKLCALFVSDNLIKKRKSGNF